MAVDSTSREMMYHHLFFMFGEKFFYRLHQRYRENEHAKKDPEFFLGANADEMMNVFAIMSSKVTRKNLLPFFDFWKFPLTQKTRNTINSYHYSAPVDFKKLPSELIKHRNKSEYDMVF
jgi:hypothetical protein